MFYFLHSPLLPSLRAKRSNPIPLLPVIASEAWQSSPSPPRHCERSVAIQSPSPRHCERSVAIQPLSSPSLRAKRSNPIPLLPVIASEAWQSSPSPPRHCERSVAIQSPSPRHCERSVAIQPLSSPSLRAKRGNPALPLPVIASEAWQSSPSPPLLAKNKKA